MWTNPSGLGPCPPQQQPGLTMVKFFTAASPCNLARMSAGVSTANHDLSVTGIPCTGFCISSVKASMGPGVWHRDPGSRHVA